MKRLLLMIVLLPTLFSACKKEKNKEANTLNQQLTGTWALPKPNVYDNVRTWQYQFNSDGTVIYSIHYTDDVTGKITGYDYRTVGKYRIVGENRLQFYDVSTYTHTDFTAAPVELNQLKLQSGNGKSFCYYSIDEKTKALTLQVECPPNADCIGKLVFSKLQ